MNVSIKTIEINRIQFESNDPDVLIKGNVKQGNLEYPTDILVSQTQLNKIVNQLKKQNENFELNEIITIDQTGMNDFLYTAKFNSEVNSRLFLHDLLQQQPYVQIRA